MTIQSKTAKNRESVLDDELTFAVLIVTNSIRKTAAWMMTNGIWNPYSGTAFTTAGLYQSAKRSRAWMRYRYRRDVDDELMNEADPEVATKEEIEWAEKYITENLPKVLKHVDELDTRLKALKRINSFVQPAGK